MNSLNDSLYLLAGAFDMFPDAVIVVDSDGLIRNANRQVFTVLGYAEVDLVGKSLNILLPERYRNVHHRMVAGFFDAPGMRKMGAGMPLFALHKDGHEINIDVALSQVNTAAEKFALAVIRDITDKMNLVNHISSAEKIKDELEQFAYVLTHDLKAPLHKVKTLAHLIHLEISEKESEDIRTMINYLNESVDGMENLITGLLDYYKAKLSKEDFALPVSLHDVLIKAQRLISVPGHFEIVEKAVLPVINANSTAMQQVFINLMYNAINHSKAKQGRLEISHSLVGNQYIISFADNGSPIPTAALSSLFDITAQIRNASGNSHGFGLSIVKDIIESNPGCKVWYEDSTLGGSCFRFSWPVPASGH